MAKQHLTQAALNEFEDVLANFKLSEIQSIFEGAGIHCETKPIYPIKRRQLARHYYANLNLTSWNDVQKLITAFEDLFDQLLQAKGQNQGASEIQPTIDKLLRRMSREGFRYEGQRFISTEKLGVDANALIALTEASISEHVEKARAKIKRCDFSGAISSAYTLVESFLKKLLSQILPQLNENEGDIRELYKMLSGPLHLNPAGEHLETYLRSILQGLKSQIGGLYELANKAGDRHTRRYNPEMHHAKLAVNAAYTLCEFLLDSFEYQQNGKAARRLNSNR